MSIPDSLGLESLLGAATAHDLLPERRRDEADRVVLPWRVVSAVDLGESATAGSSAVILVLEDARAVRFGVPAVVDAGRLRRAVPGDGVAEALVAAIAGAGAPGLEVTVFPPVASVVGERAIDVDQTNELVVVGERVVVKWVLHPTDDDQPAPARLAALARAGFQGTPRPWATVRVADGTGAVIAMVLEYVPQARDGWEWAVDDVRALARGEREEPEALAMVRDVADLVAGMHIALAAAGTLAASADDATRWHAGAVADLQASRLSGDTAERVTRAIEPLAHAVGCEVIPLHGDLHIGQVLRTAGGQYLVIDFDGNPMLAEAERMAAQPVARDVAGMLASLDHVGRVVRHRSHDLDEMQRQRVLDWIEHAQRVFLDQYRARLVESDLSSLLDESLIGPFQAQQECREYVYAERYLPHWHYVPDAALPALLERGPA